MTVREAIKKLNIENGEEIDCKIYFGFGDIYLTVRKEKGKMYLCAPQLSKDTGEKILNSPVLSCDVKLRSAYRLEICLELESVLNLIEV